MKFPARRDRLLLCTVLLWACGDSAKPQAAEELNVQAQDGAVPSQGPTIPGLPSSASPPTPSEQADLDAGADAGDAGDAAADQDAAAVPDGGLFLDAAALFMGVPSP